MRYAWITLFISLAGAAGAVAAVPRDALVVTSRVSRPVDIYLRKVGTAAPFYGGQVAPGARLLVPVARGYYEVTGFHKGSAAPDFGPVRLLVRRRVGWRLNP